MDIEIADEFGKLVATMDAHPAASFGAGLFILLLIFLRKDGTFSQWLQYLSSKAARDAGLEMRRLELMRMIEERNQMSLPGIKREEDQERP